MANIMVLIFYLSGQPVATQVIIYPDAKSCADAILDINSGKLDLTKDMPKGSTLGVSCNEPKLAGGKDA